MNNQLILKEIAQDILIISNNKGFDCGLLTGKVGEILFLYYYSLIDKQYRKIADLQLEQLISNIEKEGRYFHTYCSGFAGLGIAMYLLEASGFIEKETNQLDDIDWYLQYALEMEMKKNHYDFLHGVVGIGFYFLKHFKDRPDISRKQIEKIIFYLKNTAIIDKQNNTAKWAMLDINDRKIKYNISLSHGISSIIIFLLRVIQLNILKQKEIVIDLLVKSINYVLAQQIDCAVYGSFFPSFSLESSPDICKSRLAWCYGDLGIAMSLWQAGKVLKRNDMLDFSAKILKFSATRTDVQSNLVRDAGICHGAAGVAQIFYRMYLETKLPELYDAYLYWIKKTVEMGYHKDGIAGYKYFYKDKWVNSTNLLTGVAGIGLALLSEINPDWDEVLLLSFKE